MRVILLVEDQEYIQRLIVNSLSKQGYQVSVAANGSDALSRLGDIRADVIFVDETLPDMDSIVLIQKIRALCVQETPVIIWLNAHPSNADRVLNYQEIIDGVITKPFNPMEIIYYLKRIFAHKQEDSNG